MNYKHLSQTERYQIYSLMKAQHSITEIAQLLGRNKSTISHDLRRNSGFQKLGGVLWKNLRCQKLKKKHHDSGRDRRGQIPSIRPAWRRFGWQFQKLWRFRR